MLTTQSAQAEYFRRPADERFTSLDTLIADARMDKANSVERTYQAKDLRAVVSPDGSRVLLASPKGEAKLSHWSFGQLSSLTKAPASYLRTLPPELCARNLNHGIQHTPPASDFAALLTIKAGDDAPTVRALTTERYARVWDAPLYETIQRVATGIPGGWTPPPTWEGGKDSHGGLYRGDRDSFVILTEPGSSIVDPSFNSSPGKDGRMFRGIMIRNSEVGASSIQIAAILFRYICGNHMLWGAQIARTFAKKHTGSERSVERAAIREIQTIATQYVQRSPEQDQRIIASLIQTEIASTRQGVLDELKALGFTKDDAEASLAAAERHESQMSGYSYWAVANGATRASQESGYQDERLSLDKLAGKLITQHTRTLQFA